MKCLKGLSVLIMLVALMSAFWVGMGKQIDINENTVYDAETGRMVYIGD